MTTSEDDLDRMQAAILAAMADDDTPTWSTPDDLSRISVEALIADDTLGRTLPSRGNIRISGDGVTGASARVSEVARVMAGFQRLATAVGAAQQGDKALGRQPNADVRRRTDLLLKASPGPGSIILTLTPAISPITETGHGGGKVGMFAELETDDQLLDTAIGAAIDVFSAGNDIGPSPAQSRFVQQLAEMGPRTASALRDLSKTLDRGDSTSKSTGSNHRAPPAASRCPQRPPPTSPPPSKTPTSTNNPCKSSANTSPSARSRPGSFSKTTERP